MLEEVANALLTGCRRGRQDGEATDAAHALFRILPVQIMDDQQELDHAWELSRRYDEHPVYDLLRAAKMDGIVSPDEWH